MPKLNRNSDLYKSPDRKLQQIDKPFQRICQEKRLVLYAAGKMK